jgi:hypothetical protein
MPRAFEDTTERLATDKANLLACIRRQALGCARLGSSFYAALLNHITADVEAGGPTWTILAPHAPRPFEDAVALRLLGAVHRLVLAAQAPSLARHYPSVGGDGDPDPAWIALRALFATRAAVLAPSLDRPPQTNEVGRAAALAGGFLTVARERALPLRLLEIGASGGLQLRFDHYRYEADHLAFGDPTSPVRFVGWWEGSPPFDTPCTVAVREGCDVDPVDPSMEEGRLTLMSFVWPDQPDRLAALRGALDVAARVPVRIERAEAVDWLVAKLAQPATGAATVVFHSIVWQYLLPQDQRRVREIIEDAGRRALPDAPFAWLRFEPSLDETCCDVRLHSWPGGMDRLLGTAGYHGRPVRWLT